MSTTEGRRERIQRILKLLSKTPSGLEINEIAQKTMLITEITMDRLYKYMAELEWSNLIVQHDLKWMLNIGASSKTRERERKNQREGKKNASD